MIIKITNIRPHCTIPLVNRSPTLVMRTNFSRTWRFHSPLLNKAFTVPKTHESLCIVDILFPSMTTTGLNALPIIIGFFRQRRISLHLSSSWYRCHLQVRVQFHIIWHSLSLITRVRHNHHLVQSYIFFQDSFHFFSIILDQYSLRRNHLNLFLDSIFIKTKSKSISSYYAPS